MRWILQTATDEDHYPYDDQCNESWMSLEVEAEQNAGKNMLPNHETYSAVPCLACRKDNMGRTISLRCNTTLRSVSLRRANRARARPT